jgi:hypothetical protein
VIDMFFNKLALDLNTFLKMLQNNCFHTPSLQNREWKYFQNPSKAQCLCCPAQIENLND